VSATPLTAWCDVPAGDVRWWVAPGLSDALLGPEGLRLDEWLRNGRATVIKEGPHRVVHRVELTDGQVVYVKHNLVPDFRTLLRQLVRPSKARLEFERAIALSARGVPTIVPLALGERQIFLGAGDSFLVTRALESTQTLNNFLVDTLAKLSTARQACVRQRLATALGRLAAQCHDAGICHNDLHAANILVQLTDDDQPRLYLIDLTAVRLGPELDWPASRANLTLLTRWFVPRSSRADRLRFWRAYYEERGLGVWPRGPGHREHFALARQLEQSALQSALAFWKSRDRRCLADNRHFRRVRRPGLVGHLVADFDAPVLTTLLADPDAPLRQPGVRLMKDSRSSTVAELECVMNGVPRRLILKRFGVTDWTDPWASLLRPSPSLRSWLFGQAFRERCLPTARPLAVLHRVQAGMVREGYLLAEKIENAVDLHVFAAHLAELPTGQAQKLLRLALDAVARTIRRLHLCRLSHRDLKATNLLIDPDLDSARSPYLHVDAVAPGAPMPNHLPLPASPVWFLDLAGVTRHGRLSRSRRVQNLARLNFSFNQSQALTRTDRLRFLRSYLVWNLVGRGAWKKWWRAIDRATMRKLARNARQGRCLY
jgi:tRNA A-37 threonylcarbamoyl transferase component Bud32